jgi:ketosteroid isomerase-like protein
MLSPATQATITDRYFRLALAMDGWDIDAWVNAYTEDAVFEGPSTLTGREAIRHWVESLEVAADEWALTNTQHRLSNIVLTQGPNCVFGTSYFMWVGTNKVSNKYEIGLVGMYLDQWELYKGEWLLARRELHQGIPRKGGAQRS